ncbi:citramalate synthase, partial [Streptomyces sp. NPDC006393]
MSSSPSESTGEAAATGGLDDSFHVFDTTLRDGAQREGINLTVADKLAIARHLDDFGVGF